MNNSFIPVITGGYISTQNEHSLLTFQHMRNDNTNLEGACRLHSTTTPKPFVNNWWEVLSRKIVITSLTNHWISKERRMLLVKIGQGRNKSWTSSVVDFSRRRTSQWRNSVERRAAGYLLHPQSTIITSLSTSESSMTLQIPLPIKVSSIDFRVWKVFHERRRCYIHSR